MSSSEMLRHVALVRTDVLVECIASITANIVPTLLILVTLMKEEKDSSETSVPTRATCYNIPEDKRKFNYTEQKVNFID
jgi:hypothetical protein